MQATAERKAIETCACRKVLPSDNGRDLEKLARDMDVPVLLISADPQHIAARRDVAFLQTPFRVRDLEREVTRPLPA